MLATQGYGTGGQIATYGYGSFLGDILQALLNIRYTFIRFALKPFKREALGTFYRSAVKPFHRKPDRLTFKERRSLGFKNKK